MSRPGRRAPARACAAGLALLLVVTSCSSLREDEAPAGRAEPGPTAVDPGAAPTSGTPQPPRLRWSTCGAGFQCARLPVEGLPGGLAVTRLRASGPRIGSLVVNPGGPGAGAVDFLQGAVSSLPRALRQRFDLVAFDPRGVGRSQGVRCLSTAQLDRHYALDPDPDDPRELQALVRSARGFADGCRRRSGAVLHQVSTSVVAEDLDRLREALGEPRLTYLGYSYGTAIGAAYLERFPTRVRAMVLDGALDPALGWDGLLEGQSRGFDRALLAFLADCERTTCPFRLAVDGGLVAAYDALARRVERRPMAAGGGRVLGPGELSLGAGGGLYDRDYGWITLGQALADAVDGDGELLLALSDGYLGRGEQGYDPLGEAGTAVSCTDRPWPREPAAYVALAERVAQRSPRFGRTIVLSGLVCASWPVRPATQPGPVRAVGAPPVVVLGTTGDPATPYAWSRSLAEQLDRGVLLTHVGDGHTAYRAGGSRCVASRVTAYLLTARAPVATHCGPGH